MRQPTLRPPTTMCTYCGQYARMASIYLHLRCTKRSYPAAIMPSIICSLPWGSWDVDLDEDSHIGLSRNSRLSHDDGRPTVETVKKRIIRADDYLGFRAAQARQLVVIAKHIFGDREVETCQMVAIALYIFGSRTAEACQSVVPATHLFSGRAAETR